MNCRSMGISNSAKIVRRYMAWKEDYRILKVKMCSARCSVLLRALMETRKESSKGLINRKDSRSDLRAS